MTGKLFSPCLLDVHRASYVPPSWTEDYLIFLLPSRRLYPRSLARLHHLGWPCPSPNPCTTVLNAIVLHGQALATALLSPLPPCISPTVASTLAGDRPRPLSLRTLHSLLGTCMPDMPPYRAHWTIQRFPTFSVQLLFLVYSR